MALEPFGKHVQVHLPAVAQRRVFFGRRRLGDTASCVGGRHCEGGGTLTLRVSQDGEHLAVWMTGKEN